MGCLIIIILLISTLYKENYFPSCFISTNDKIVNIFVIQSRFMRAVSQIVIIIATIIGFEYLCRCWYVWRTI